MSTSFQVTDEVNTNLPDVPIKLNSFASFAKYAKNAVLQAVVLPNLLKVLKQPIAAAAEEPLDFGLKFSDTVAFGSGETALTVGSGVDQKLHIHARPGSSFLGGDDFGTPVVVAPGEAYVSLDLSIGIEPSLSQTTGQFTFGFDSGSRIQVEYFRRVAATATSPTVGTALGEVISNFTIPADVTDLASLPEGDIVVITGSGKLGFSAAASVATSPNPLASLRLPLISQTIDVQAGGEVDVSASFTVSGSYQIRVRRLPGGTVELGYYRKRGTEWNVAAGVSAGAGVTFGGTELIEKLISAISSDPKADVEKLQQAALSPDEIGTINAAIKQSIAHSLKASLEVDLSGSGEDEPAFLFHIDTSVLSDEAHAAVNGALRADFTELTRLEQDAGDRPEIAPGITLLRSAIIAARQHHSAMKVNLFGIVNLGSFTELLRNSTAVFEPVTGDLTIHETVQTNREEILSLPQSHDKLHKLTFDSLLLTTAYRATRAISTMNVTSSDVHFEFHSNTDNTTLNRYLTGVAAIGLLSASDQKAIVSGAHESGASTCVLRVEFSDAACESMFVDSSGTARTESDYQSIGRNVMSALLADSTDTTGIAAARAKVLASDSLWAQMVQQGQPAFPQLLRGHVDASAVQVITGDYSEIVWWARAMRTAASNLVRVRQFIAAAAPATLHDNPDFTELRKRLQSSIAAVVSTSGLRFSLPFGIVALYRAASGATPTASIVSSAFTGHFELPRVRPA